jgi:hypothetical protein
MAIASRLAPTMDRVEWILVAVIQFGGDRLAQGLNKR